MPIIYTEEFLTKLVKKYKTRRAFCLDYPSGYMAARRLKIWDKITTHMGPPKNKPYTIEELKQKASLYKSRSEFERKDKKGYSAVINRKLGHIVFKNLPEIKKRKYTRSELSLIYSSCYSIRNLYEKYGRTVVHAAKRRGIYRELQELFNPGVPPGLCFEEIAEIAVNCENLKQFKSQKYFAYLTASRMGILNKLLYLKDKNRPKRVKKESMSLEEILSISSKFITKKDFKNQEPKTYEYAKRNQLLLKSCAHMKFPRSNLSIDDIYKKIKEFKTRGDLVASEPYVYRMAKGYSILEEACSHMKRLVRKKYTDIELIELSLNFKYRDDVRIAHLGAYSAIMSRGIAEIAFAHMPPKKFGKMEKEVKTFIETKYECRKYRDNNVLIPNKPYMKKFEIDILVPKLNKGIEFDGTYWHSPKALKSRRPLWSNDEIENYHQIKDEYFKSKGIEILHIKEKDWIERKDHCKELILSFLLLKTQFL